ncbi:AtpZ/AtpI family protein [Aureimonas sp. SA4125]|uniref:AtpZ/AtpI family protein n=1 Tax=Aureimonas sp. SA4125 TaxID=2826993 RepID=UPI001CC3A435|nr:AtpZ/AtpI family protein [Aureimonas sp. SA4125]
MDRQEEREADASGAPEEWQRRREQLAEKLAAQRARSGPAVAAGSSAGGMKGAADGMKLASEFVAGILAGAGIGYLFDRIVGTSPFGLIVFLILGFVAGVLNVLRSVGKTGSAATQPPKEAAMSKNPPPD